MYTLAEAVIAILIVLSKFSIICVLSSLMINTKITKVFSRLLRKLEKKLNNLFYV